MYKNMSILLNLLPNKIMYFKGRLFEIQMTKFWICVGRIHQVQYYVEILHEFDISRVF